LRAHRDLVAVVCARVLIGAARDARAAGAAGDACVVPPAAALRQPDEMRLGRAKTAPRRRGSLAPMEEAGDGREICLARRVRFGRAR
jgi:hypothetical protein